jgi:hypothetical protein
MLPTAITTNAIAAIAAMAISPPPPWIVESQN